QLVRHPDGTFTYTAKDQTEIDFDEHGRMTAVTDPHGLARRYFYDEQGRLVEVTSPDGGVTSLEYAGGLLTRITEPGGRHLLLEHAGGDLTGLTDVDGSARRLDYDGHHHLTRDRWQPLDATFRYDPASGLLVGIDRGPGSTYTFGPVAWQTLQ